MAVTDTACIVCRKKGYHFIDQANSVFNIKRYRWDVSVQAAKNKE